MPSGVYIRTKSRKGICFNTGRTHFKKGHTSWLKGKKGIHNSPSTEFKKGNKLSEKTRIKIARSTKKTYKMGRIGWNKDIPRSEETRMKIKRAKQNTSHRGKKVWNWKGGITTLKYKEDLAGRKKPKNCENCGRNDKRICFDHDHKTGKFRGWICSNCNFVLGMINDDIKLLIKLINYLQKYENNK